MTPDASLNVILQQGLVGAFCFLLIFVVRHLFNLHNTCQEEKIAILREALDAAKPLAEAIKELTASHKLLAEKIQRLEDDGRK